jgi:hypothetical protein
MRQPEPGRSRQRTVPYRSNSCGEKFDADSALVEEDLKALKHILENKRDVELRQPT